MSKSPNRKIGIIFDVQKKTIFVDTIKFIFYLGIAFSIFQFLWWMVNILINYIRGTGAKNMVTTYILKAIHYLVLMPVTVSFISIKAEQGKIGGQSNWYYYAIIFVVTLVYLFGRIQRRQKINRVRTALNTAFQNSVPPFNMKTELAVSGLAILMLVACIFIPELHQNNFIGFIAKSIAGIYDAFLIGIIFRIVGIIFVISLFWRMISGLRVLFGQEPNEDNFQVYVNEEQQGQGIDEEVEYTEYEEVENENESK